MIKCAVAPPIGGDIPSRRTLEGKRTSRKKRENLETELERRTRIAFVPVPLMSLAEMLFV